MKISKLTKIAGIALLAILLFFLGRCTSNKRCGQSVVRVETDTVYIVDTDTFNVTTKGKTKYVPFVDSIFIADTFALDSLKRVYDARWQEMQLRADHYKEVIDALEAALPGDILIVESPHYDIEGETLSSDGKATIKWSITVTDSTAIVPGDSTKPNPRFFVEQLIPVEFNQTETTTKPAKRNAGGIGVLLSSNGQNLNGMAVVKLRMGKTDYLGGYDPFGKLYLIGIVRELQFGKTK